MANDNGHPFSDKSVCVALVASGLLTKEQDLEIYEKKDKVRANIEKQKNQRSGTVPAGVRITNPTTIVDVIISFKFSRADQSDVELDEDIDRVSLMPVKTVVTSKTDIIRLIDEFFGFKRSIAQAETQFDSSSAVDLGNQEQYIRLKSSDELPSNDHHTVRFGCFNDGTPGVERVLSIQWLSGSYGLSFHRQF